VEIMRRDICKGLGKAQDWALRALQGDGEEQAALLESFASSLQSSRMEGGGKQREELPGSRYRCIINRSCLSASACALH